jgi:DNA polymerase-3 subunit alpha
MIHLHNHTEGSTLDGMSKIKKLVARAKELGMSAIGISDHGNMIKSLDFQEECIKKGVKPIIGCEFYISHDTESKDNFHILCIAKNNTGLKNLYKLNKFAYMKNFYYKPRITFEQLLIHKEGLIITTACVGSEFGQDFLAKKNIGEKIAKYKECFNEDFYLEIQPNAIPEQKHYNAMLVKCSLSYNIPLIVTCDAHYVKKEDSIAHDVMLAMQVKKKVDDPNRFRFTGDDFYIKTDEEILSDLSYLPQNEVAKAIMNTRLIAEQCDAKIETGLNLLPVMSGITDNDMELAKHCNTGFIKRVKEGMPNTKEYVDRVKYELSIIRQKGYAGYFLVVEDFMNEARRRDILVGAGRGSASGSLVAYILGITNVDPIKYHLLFERMLNPERIAEPDID